MPYPVFTSYAQLDRDDDGNLERFVEELRQELRSLRGTPDARSLAFFDRDGIKAGDRWSQVVIDEVNTADVLVCLMSPTYFQREWCGRELGVFLSRAGSLPDEATSARFIFPVWWRLPTAPRPIPSKLGAHHYRDAQFPPKYETLGVRGLARRNLWVQFRAMADRLAGLISETLDQPYRLAAGEPVADIMEIVNAFDEQQPYDVRWVALTPGGGSWIPSGGSATIGAAAAETAERLTVFFRPLETGDEMRARLEQAREERQVLLVVANAADAAAAPDDSSLTLNDLDLPNLALLLVDDAAQGSDSWVNRMPSGAFASAKTEGRLRVVVGAEMQRQMESLVDEVRRRLQRAAPATRVEDSALEQRAVEQGIAIHAQPTLAGPGGKE